MQIINLSDELYQVAQRRAADAGFDSIASYITDLLQKEVNTPLEFSNFFTPARLEGIDRAAAQADAGRVISIAEAHERLQRKISDEQ